MAVQHPITKQYYQTSINQEITVRAVESSLHSESFCQWPRLHLLSSFPHAAESIRVHHDASLSLAEAIVEQVLSVDSWW